MNDHQQDEHRPSECQWCPVCRTIRLSDGATDDVAALTNRMLTELAKIARIVMDLGKRHTESNPDSAQLDGVVSVATDMFDRVIDLATAQDQAQRQQPGPDLVDDVIATPAVDPRQQTMDLDGLTADADAHGPARG